ncbi:MAG: hypothetical protein HC903_18425 [Methylacidiphilales bacterium]|nr:hypothetical protein [Candidatus Methylacidiphilales bacterium]NJR15641.1 hypothetical protein [Calothrix sp. CSU_2_0]
MSGTKADLKKQVEQLAEEAFHRKLISGYGDGEDIDEYQIVFQGKPRHLPLDRAYRFLTALLNPNSMI